MCFNAKIMREREMRHVLELVCRQLDVRAMARLGATGVVLGASSLLVNGGCGADSTLPGPTDSGTPGRDGATDAGDGGSIGIMYMAPMPDAMDTGPTPEYAVVFDASLDQGPVPPYMVQPVDAGLDQGPVLPYMGPLPE